MMRVLVIHDRIMTMIDLGSALAVGVWGVSKVAWWRMLRLWMRTTLMTQCTQCKVFQHGQCKPMQELFGEVWRSGKCAEKYTNRLGRVSQNLVRKNSQRSTCRDFFNFLGRSLHQRIPLKWSLNILSWPLIFLKS